MTRRGGAEEYSCPAENITWPWTSLYQLALDYLPSRLALLPVVAILDVEYFITLLSETTITVLPSIRPLVNLSSHFLFVYLFVIYLLHFTLLLNVLLTCLLIRSLTHSLIVWLIDYLFICLLCCVFIISIYLIALIRLAGWWKGVVPAFKVPFLSTWPNLHERWICRLNK